MNTLLAPFRTLNLSKQAVRDLRSDHAGETGAVAIYRGILAVSRHREVRRFAVNHLKTEKTHLSFFNSWLPQEYWSRLLPVWAAAGWCLGAVSAIFGPRAVFRTIASVESFVEDHYRAQIEVLSEVPELRPLASTLQAFCDEETEHKEDAMRRHPAAEGFVARIWGHVVGAGSAVGVALARNV